MKRAENTISSQAKVKQDHGKIWDKNDNTE